MLNKFVKKLNTGTLVGLLMFLNAGVVKADCASMYRRHAKVDRAKLAPSGFADAIGKAGWTALRPEWTEEGLS